MEAFGKLALRCVRFNPEENVPHMIVVAREVKEIETYTQNFSSRCFFFSLTFLLFELLCNSYCVYESEFYNSEINDFQRTEKNPRFETSEHNFQIRVEIYIQDAAV